MLPAATDWVAFAQKAAELMDPYRHTPGWSVFVEACPELAIPEDSDEEDWRAGLAKVKALPAVKSEVAAAAEVPMVVEAPIAPQPPAPLPLPAAIPPSVPILPANTSRTGPSPRPIVIQPVASAPSLSPVHVLDPLPAVSPPVLSNTANPLLVSDRSEDEDEDEGDGDDSEGDEIVDLTADHEAAAAVDDEEEPAVLVVPKRRKSNKVVRGSRQVAKDFPSEIRPEDTSLGAHRAGPDLVVRPTLVSLDSC